MQDLNELVLESITGRAIIPSKLKPGLAGLPLFETAYKFKKLLFPLFHLPL